MRDDPIFPMEDIRGAVARGWCADKNRHKELDSDLAEAISKEIWLLIYEFPYADDKGTT